MFERWAFYKQMLMGMPAPQWTRNLQQRKLLGKWLMGGENVSCDFFLGGGETYHRARPPKPVLEASESGIAWSEPVSSKKNNRAKTNGGGGKRIIGGGSKTVFGKGFHGMFSPPLSFPPPFVFSE